MGWSRWDPEDFAAFTKAHTAGRSRAAVFSSRGPADEFDPSKFFVRESRDSAANPRSTPIMLMSDVTGSMGATAEHMIRHGIDTVMREIYARTPVTDPHVLAGGIGDAYFDRAPIQMTQFESSVVLAEQLKRIWIEGGGGGNAGESYLAAHYAAGMKTSHDAFEKRGRKGFLLTMGDEPALGTLTRAQVKATFGIDVERDLSAADCLAIAQRSYECFHIVLCDVGHAAQDLAGVMRTWTPLLGERALKLTDHAKVAELIVSTIQVVAGEDAGSVASSWGGSTALVVGQALGALAKGARRTGGVVRF